MQNNRCARRARSFYSAREQIAQCMHEMEILQAQRRELVMINRGQSDEMGVSKSA